MNCNFKSKRAFNDNTFWMQESNILDEDEQDNDLSNDITDDEYQFDKTESKISPEEKNGFIFRLKR